MQGYSPKLPLQQDIAESGIYGLNKTILDTIKQNLKMLLLTNPGERIMNLDFGVGLKRFLFEQDIETVRTELEGRIGTQVARYLNFITIEEINFSDPSSNEENLLFIEIKYKIPSLNTIDQLNILI